MIMNNIHKATDVFTPNTYARLNFIERTELENRLVDTLRTPGRQVIIYGHSGSGKSSLIHKKLDELYERHITTKCQRRSTLDSILLDAFDQLDQFYLASQGSDTSTERERSIEAQFLDIRAALRS